MKKIIIASLFALSANAFATGNPADFPSDFPTNWEQNKIAKACGFHVSELEGTVGVTTRKNGRVYYSALSGGNIVAQAYRKQWTTKLICSN